MSNINIEQEQKIVGYGDDYTPENISDLYDMINLRKSAGLPLYGRAILSEKVEGEEYPKRFGLTITHDGGVLDDEHGEYEE